jgi:hypothetical protein
MKFWIALFLYYAAPVVLGAVGLYATCRIIRAGFSRRSS